MVLTKKFSATNFWRHAYEHNATVTQYIGELARYLLNSPESEYDTKHNVRLAMGNGMRKEVWVPFQKRFRVAEIGEFYGTPYRAPLHRTITTTTHACSLLTTLSLPLLMPAPCCTPGATEGNVSFQIHSKTQDFITFPGNGAMGSTGELMKWLMGWQVVQHDVASEEPIRDPKTGFCIRCKQGEPGELLGLISEISPLKFEGYTSDEATNKKVRSH
jgi:acyl-CoA synthetase (AMP-forming)/AMP-acid ligase II